MQTALLAAGAMAAGTAAGFCLCWLGSRLAKRRATATRKPRSRQEREEKKPMGTMDKVLILEGVTLAAYTVAALAVFWHTGSEPATLTACVFAVCGMENGVMAWIKTTKDKLLDRKWQLEDAAKEEARYAERQDQ